MSYAEPIIYTTFAIVFCIIVIFIVRKLDTHEFRWEKKDDN